ncbi:ABC transporter substrate-binding protein [Acrocarpospora catenulata]|uniref:ABC transporter substrate-binding protein n=1 Tax=Acrocarpospora catenulata TaxID=2836182 RepID=UPI001BD9B187|nr:ABC transporter substrate-binding protein [Acrocarpospora catenulata]
MKRVRTMAALTTSVVALMAAAACGGHESTSGSDGTTFQLAAVADFTGPASGLGKTYTNMIKMSVDDINKAGGFTVNGKKVTFKLTTVDHQSNPSVAVTEVRKLMDNPGIKLLLGDTTTVAQALQPVLTPRKIPMVWLGSDPSVIQAGGGNYFGVLPGPNDRASLLGQYLSQNGITKAAIIAEDSGYGNAYAKEFNTTLPTFGIDVTGTEKFPADGTDFTTPLTSLRKGDPQAIIMLTFPKAGGLIAKQARELRFTGDIVSDGTAASGSDFVSSGGSAVDGVITLDYGTDPLYQDKTTQEVTSRFQEEYGFAPASVGLYYYEYPQLIAKALSDAGTLTDEAKIREAISKASVDGIAGHIQFVTQAGGRVPANQALPVLSIVTWKGDGSRVKGSTWTRDPQSGDWSEAK